MFAAMLALMALRMPIAAAMFIPGAVGYLVISDAGFAAQPAQGQRGGAADGVRPVGDPAVPADGAVRHAGRPEPARCSAPRRRGSGMCAAGWAWPPAGGRRLRRGVRQSSVATSATITQVAYPEMRRHGYAGRLATATLAAGGTLGILIPPSVPLVVYAILTEQNIAKLFAAAILPGHARDGRLHDRRVAPLRAAWRARARTAGGRRPRGR
jgi:C4-dicarboxylate transporter DctM subunit